MPKAQVTYHNYLDCSSEWRYYVQGNSSAGPYTNWFITKYFDGDTLINGIYYYRQKILGRIEGDTTGFASGFSGYGVSDYFIREDSNANFIGYGFNFFTGTNTFDTLYKFNGIKQLNIGDSLIKTNSHFGLPDFNSYNSDNATVLKIDSFTLGSRTLRAIFPMDSSYGVTGKVPTIYTCIVEGIGATFPGFFYSGAGDQSVLYMFYYKRQFNQLAFNLSPFTYSLDSFPTPIRIYNCSVLPLKLLSFSAQKENNNVLLNWQTANEVTVSHINVQRSINNKDFIDIGKVSATCCAYSFVDGQLSTVDSKLYYRLEIVDKDGSKTYSEIRNVELGIRNVGISIYPNPAIEQVTITCKNAKEILVIDYLGKPVYQSTVDSRPLTVNTKQLVKGIYVVKAIMINGQIKTEKLVVE
jgi:hypothetical protein